MVKTKRNTILFIMMMILTVFIASAGNSNADEEAKQSEDSSEPVSAAITTEDLEKNLNDDSWVVVDTRINDAFNGWN